MKRRSVLAAAGIVVISRPGRAQAYPDRPIRVVVPYAPGGATDTGARALGERLEKILGQPVVVENKAGGGTIIGTETVAKAKSEPVSYASASGGSMQHLWAELIRMRLGLRLEHVGYKGSSEAVRDVMGGHLPLLVDLVVPTGAAVKSGKLRGVAVATSKRSFLLADVPPVGEVG